MLGDRSRQTSTMTGVCLVSALLFALFSQGSAASCSLPDDIRGAWEDSDKGILTFGNSTVSGYVIHTFGSFDLSCYLQNGSVYIMESNSFFFFSLNFTAYFCWNFIKVTDDLYYFYEYSLPLADAGNEKVKMYLPFSVRDYNEMCANTNPGTGTYRVLFRNQTLSTSISNCPSYLQNYFSFSVYVSGNRVCPGSDTLDGCSNSKTLKYNVNGSTNCSTSLAYSAGGEISCLFYITEGTTTYLTLYNNDASVDDSTTYQTTCMVIDNQELVATQYPKKCQDDQNTTYVASPGASIYLTLTSSCPTSTLNLLWLIGVVLGLLLIAAMLCACFLYRKKRRDDELKRKLELERAGDDGRGGEDDKINTRGDQPPGVTIAIMEGRSRGLKDMQRDGKAGFRESGEVTPSGIRPSYDAPHRRFSKRRRVWVIGDDGKVVKVWKERDGKESPDSGLEEDETDGQGGQAGKGDYFDKKRKEKEEKEFQKQFGRKDIKETNELTERGDMAPTSNKLKDKIKKMAGIRSFAKNIKKRSKKNKKREGSAYEQPANLSSVQEGDTSDSDDDADNSVAGGKLSMMSETEPGMKSGKQDSKGKAAAGKGGSGDGQDRVSPDSGKGRDSVTSDSSGHGSATGTGSGDGQSKRSGSSQRDGKDKKSGAADEDGDEGGDERGGGKGRGGGRGGDNNKKGGGGGGGSGGAGSGGEGGSGSGAGTGGRAGGQDSSGGGGSGGGGGGGGGGGDGDKPSGRTGGSGGRDAVDGTEYGGGDGSQRGGGTTHAHPGQVPGSGRSVSSPSGEGGRGGDAGGGRGGDSKHPAALTRQSSLTKLGSKDSKTGGRGGNDSTRDSKGAKDKLPKPGSKPGEVITIPPLAMSLGSNGSDAGGTDNGSAGREGAHGDSAKGDGRQGADRPGHPGLKVGKSGGWTVSSKDTPLDHDSGMIQVTPRGSTSTQGAKQGQKGQDGKPASDPKQKSRFSLSQDSTVSTINANSDLDWADQFNQGLVAVETSRPPTGHQRRRGWAERSSPDRSTSALTEQQKAQNLARSLSDRLTDTRSVHFPDSSSQSEQGVPSTADTRRSVRWKEGGASEGSRYLSVPITANMGIRRYPEQEDGSISRDSPAYKSMSHLARIHRKRKVVAPVLDDPVIERQGRLPVVRPDDMDDLAWKRLLEELYPDKKYLDYAKESSKQEPDDPEEGFLHTKAGEGLTYLHDRARFWESQKPLVRPGTSMSVRSVSGRESRATSALPPRSREGSTRFPRGSREKGPI